MIEQHPMRRSRSKSPSLDEARLRQQAIGVRLRQMFDEVVSEPVPDEFLQILRKADDKRSGELTTTPSGTRRSGASWSASSRICARSPARCAAIRPPPTTWRRTRC
jgi:hypothetical protein